MRMQAEEGHREIKEANNIKVTARQSDRVTGWQNDGG